jgi:hypothetical protein
VSGANAIAGLDVVIMVLVIIVVGIGVMGSSGVGRRGRRKGDRAAGFDA